MQPKLRRLQSRGRPGNIAAQEHRPRRLQRRAASPRLGLQSQLPSPGRNLLHHTSHTGKRKWQLVVNDFEIYSPIVDIDARQMIRRSADRSRQPVNRRKSAWHVDLGGRQPALQIPAAFLVSNQISNSAG